MAHREGDRSPPRLFPAQTQVGRRGLGAYRTSSRRWGSRRWAEFVAFLGERLKAYDLHGTDANSAATYSAVRATKARMMSRSMIKRSQRHERKAGWTSRAAPCLDEGERPAVISSTVVRDPQGMFPARKIKIGFAS